MGPTTREDRIMHYASTYRDARDAFRKVDMQDLAAADKAHDAIAKAASSLLAAAEEVE
jgi:hypothetical protein